MCLNFRFTIPESRVTSYKSRTFSPQRSQTRSRGFCGRAAEKFKNYFWVRIKAKTTPNFVCGEKGFCLGSKFVYYKKSPSLLHFSRRNSVTLSASSAVKEPKRRKRSTVNTKSRGSCGSKRWGRMQDQNPGFAKKI